jgi:hypothetical protein
MSILDAAANVMRGNVEMKRHSLWYLIRALMVIAGFC